MKKNRIIFFMIFTMIFCAFCLISCEKEKDDIPSIQEENIQTEQEKDEDKETEKEPEGKLPNQIQGGLKDGGIYQGH